MSSHRKSWDDLVSVVVPAFNAEVTIDETLRSVRSQTHRRIEIIVVDDGSTDGTVEVAKRHAAADPRLQIVSQPNAGVAAARNTGWHAATSDIISFVDADDLWSVDKTERQLAALSANPEAGLVYSWYVVIDAASRIALQWEGVEWEGQVFDKLLTDNFVGNGSSAMVTRRALEDANGFEPAMRAASAGGCEDILFYTRVAEHHSFALARGHLVGYRYLEGNMSSDLARMLRSWLWVRAEMTARHPDKVALMDEGLDRFARWLVRRSVELSQPRHLPALFKALNRVSPSSARNIFRTEIPKAICDFHWPARRADASAAALARPPFEIGTPSDEL